MTPDGQDSVTEADVDAFLFELDSEDHIHRDTVRDGLTAVMPAACRRAIAANLRALAACYPAEVFPADGQSRDAVSGTALRVVLTAQAALYQDGG